ncbi:MAG: hypothetical protein ACR2ML_13885 [Solirubrobacteraceae bacterium]
MQEKPTDDEGLDQSGEEARPDDEPLSDRVLGGPTATDEPAEKGAKGTRESPFEPHE